MKNFIVSITLFFIIVLIAPQDAMSQDKNVEAFFKGKTITMVIVYAPGGSYDLWARTLAPFIKKHTGASNVIVQNMPGAGGLAGGAYMYSIAKPDGLTMAIVPMAGMAVAELLELPAVKYDLDKFNYICRFEISERALFASKASGFKSVADMQKATKPIRFGATDVSSESSVEKALIAEALGLKAKIITGYKGSQSYILATIAGRELDAATTSLAGQEDYVKAGDLSLVSILDSERNANFPEKQTIYETRGLKPEGMKLLELLASFGQGGRIIIAPPGVSEARRAFLSEALLRCLKEPALLAWAKNTGRRISPLSGKECKELVSKLTKLVPKSERAKFKYITTEKYF